LSQEGRGSEKGWTDGGSPFTGLDERWLGDPDKGWMSLHDREEGAFLKFPVHF